VNRREYSPDEVARGSGRAGRTLTRDRRSGRVSDRLHETDVIPGGATGSTATAAPGVGPVVEFDGVSRLFGTFVAVDDVSFAIERGEFFSIIGPSGSGKTTTIRMIAGLEQPTEGSIRMFGRDVTSVPAYDRNTPMVFQSLALFPHLDVRRNVEYGLRMRKVPRAERAARADRALALVGLEGLGGRRPDQLSGGQQQRVAVARAIVTEPSVVLLDEALGALDAKLRVEMQSELKRLQRSLGVTFVHVTHDQSEALAMADRILVMHLGQVEQVGQPSEVFAEPATRFVAGFVGRKNLLDGRVARRRDADHVDVDTPIGTIPAVGPDVTEGETVTLVIRADAVRRELGELPVSVEADVVGAEYQGTSVTYQLELQGETVFRMEEHESLTSGRPLAPGERIRVGWNVEDAYVLT
jgi:ABC-type Fe3+/spermidine/putrescine transport system ATPase subunit